ASHMYPTTFYYCPFPRRVLLSPPQTSPRPPLTPLYLLHFGGASTPRSSVEEFVKHNLSTLVLLSSTLKKDEGITTSAIAMLTMIQRLAEPGQALTCGQVDASLAPCILILLRRIQEYSCNSVKALNGMSQNTADRRLHNCVKAANRHANLKHNASQALPNKCRITLDIPVSRSINCDM
ncbi:hypothetical protein HAX54_017836, partial [Datura stramonium]|nr:hypothetical protein [Datura stramonium]